MTDSLIYCYCPDPNCGQLAEVLFTWPMLVHTVDGTRPELHASTMCLAQHHFTVELSSLVMA